LYQSFSSFISSLIFLTLNPLNHMSVITLQMTMTSRLDPAVIDTRFAGASQAALFLALFGPNSNVGQINPLPSNFPSLLGTGNRVELTANDSTGGLVLISGDGVPVSGSKLLSMDIIPYGDNTLDEFYGVVARIKSPSGAIVPTYFPALPMNIAGLSNADFGYEVLPNGGVSVTALNPSSIPGAISWAPLFASYSPASPGSAAIMDRVYAINMVLDATTTSGSNDNALRLGVALFPTANGTGTATNIANLTSLPVPALADPNDNGIVCIFPTLNGQPFTEIYLWEPTPSPTFVWNGASYTDRRMTGRIVISRGTTEGLVIPL
jgi:hypothetical protein